MKAAPQALPGLSDEDVRSLMIDLKSKQPSNTVNNAHILSVIIGRVNSRLQVGAGDILEVLEQRQRSCDQEVQRLCQFD